MEEETQILNVHKETKPRLEKIASLVLMGTAFLMPIFFIPSSIFPIPFAKSIFLYTGVIVSLIIFLFSILETGKVRLPVSPIFYAAFLIPVVFLVSSLSSSSVMTSLVGYGIEVGTFASVLLMIVLMALVAYLYREKERVFYSYLLYFVSFGIVTLYQLLRLVFGPNFLSFGVFTTSASNLVGSWNDLGVFFAIAALLAVITLELLVVNKIFKVLLYSALVVSLIFVSIINFTTLWYILAAFSLAFFLYVLFLQKGYNNEDHAVQGSRKISYISILVLILSLIFIFGGTTLGGHIAEKLKVSNLEVRPSWKTTLDVTNQTLARNLLLGSGPNTFQQEWSMYKPLAINSTPFWNTDFSYGIGLIPTFLTTTGILGFLSWILLFGLLLYTGFRAIFVTSKDSLAHYLVTSSFVASVCLWTMLILYVPSIIMVALTFIFTGLFLASVMNEGIIRQKEFTLYHNARVGFVTVLASIFTLILVIAGGYYMAKGFISTSYFQKSLLSASQNNVSQAERDMQTAINLRGYDIYYRSLAQIHMLKLNALLAQQNVDPAQLRQQFQAGLGQAIQTALQAVSADPKNYQNYIELGQIYEAVVPEPFKIDGAYEKAKESYDKAIVLNPQNPELRLLEGRLEIAQKNLDAARTQINLAIQQKPDYVEAYFLLSQVEVASGNLQKAITSVDSAVYLAPNNAGIYFQLGLLKYNNSDWNGSIQAFEKAISIVSNYANAKYFLGLSYDKVGRRADAIKQFEELKVTNPDNAEVKLILNNLHADKVPFAGVTPPAAAQPEKGKNLPVKQ